MSQGIAACNCYRSRRLRALEDEITNLKKLLAEAIRVNVVKVKLSKFVSHPTRQV